MMVHAQGSSKSHCTLLAVLSGNASDDKQKKTGPGDQPKYPLPELASSGRLEVQVLNNPSTDEFRRALESSEPNFVYLQGEQSEDSDEVGSLMYCGVDLSDPEALISVFGSKLPITVYLEVPNGEKLAEAAHSQGVPYVIYWKGVFSRYAAVHFRQVLLSVIQSSCSHIWDAFQLADASFRLYCVRNDLVSPFKDHNTNAETGPLLLGECPKINIDLPEADEEGEEDSNLPSIKIYDEDATMRFLICGFPGKPDAFLLESLEDGLNALLRIEVRGSKLNNRTSAPPPPLQAGTFTRGVVTMRCDISTCSSTHISLLVSGSAQTCFNDQLLENHIKHELIEKSHLVHSMPSSDEGELLSLPRKSASIACGASVFEVCLKVPTWASQVLRQLAPDVSYRSLVSLGIAAIQGLSVASFEKDDAERLLFFCKRQWDKNPSNSVVLEPPHWLTPPAPCRKRTEPCRENKQKMYLAAMRPIPRARRPKRVQLYGNDSDKYDGDQPKASNPSAGPTKNNPAGPNPTSNRKAFLSSYQQKQIISLNPLPLKKHDCGRAPIQECSEEEFLKDVMQFLLLRGHTRLVPQGGLAEFPDAILNAKRLDLFNLYREVVSRGGFHVGNGINWKGQVFSKMRNHTLTNRMTGVGNTLKRHYETYLLEYEYAHDDVDGECCLLCHSSAAGDWVNCGICGEWAHFGCDRRQGLGAFKDYAKTDGLEYICPHCSVSKFRKKTPRQQTTNGY